MKTREVAAWMRVEHEKVQDLANILRENAAVVPRVNLAAWIKDMQSRFEHFRAHLIKHMALEEHEGYLSIVVERRPALSPEVNRLQNEHRELTRIMDGIYEASKGLTAEDRLLVRDCCYRLHGLLGYIERHEELENNLVTFAFTQDLGENH